MDELRAALEDLQHAVSGLKQTLAMGSNIARTEIDELERRMDVAAIAFKSIDKKAKKTDE